MITRRIFACACALALAVPAAASARVAVEPPINTTDHVVYGDTKYDLQNTQQLAAPGVTGDTKDDVVAPAGKNTGAIAAVQSKQPVADDGTDGWRIAAVAEAGLLAAFVLGAATFVGRMRPRRGATA